MNVRALRAKELETLQTNNAHTPLLLPSLGGACRGGQKSSHISKLINQKLVLPQLYKVSFTVGAVTMRASEGGFILNNAGRTFS
jgi:hypothetical protein